MQDIINDACLILFIVIMINVNLTPVVLVDRLPIRMNG